MPLKERLPPLALLFFLAPWVGEYLLGNVPGTWLWALPFLAPMYGGGAILVREIAIRGGLAWPGILLLGAGYGLIEAGLVDQSLFNPGFMGLEFQAVTPVPALGISALNATAFIVGHAVWSIALPIAFTQFLFPRAAGRPWLGRPGLVVVTALYLIGCWIIFDDVRSTEGFMATPAQHVGAALAALACGGLALMSRRITGGPTIAPPRPLAMGVLGFVLSGAFVLAPESWTGFALKVVLLAVWAVAAWALTRHPGWTPRHSVAFAGGMLMTYAWLGPVLTTIVHGGGHIHYSWNAGFALLAAGLVALAFRRVSARGRATR
jgi:hypothetical protein